MLRKELTERALIKLLVPFVKQRSVDLDPLTILALRVPREHLLIARFHYRSDCLPKEPNGILLILPKANTKHTAQEKCDGAEAPSL